MIGALLHHLTAQRGLQRASLTGHSATPCRRMRLAGTSEHGFHNRNEGLSNFNRGMIIRLVTREVGRLARRPMFR